MSTILDVFNTDIFSTVSLTQSMQVLPVKPMRIGQLGLFTPKPLATRTAVLERQDRTISILSTAEWGSPGTVGKTDKRKARPFSIPHTPHDDVVLASEIQGVRKFGSEDQLESVQDKVLDKLGRMKQNHEVTHEYRRAAALSGYVYDANGSTLVDLWTDFGISRSTQDFVFGTSTSKIRSFCLAIKRVIERALGNGGLINQIRGLCSETFFNALIEHAVVTTAYERWQAGEQLRNDPRAAFPFGGILWEEYSGSVGGTPFVTEGDANVFPVGVPELFVEAFAPGDNISAANRTALPYYAMQEMMEFEKGIKLHTESNELPLCAVPEVLVRAYSST